ncbi:vasa [Carabus blaptoides fortunei]
MSKIFPQWSYNTPPQDALCWQHNCGCFVQPVETKMDDNWDDTPSTSTTDAEFVDTGRNFSRGRGFSKTVSDGPGYSDNGWGADNNDGGGRNNNDDFNGGHGRRGGRGGRGGSRGNSNRGGFRGRGRGGFRNNDNDDEWGGNSGGGDDDGGSFGGRGGRGGRGGGRGRGNDFGDDSDGKPEKPREIYVPADPTEDESEMFGTSITSGINFDKYDNIPVEVTGDNVLPAINSFAEANLRQILLDNIKKSGYNRPTPIQKIALPIILAGRDVMACAQTGSGKTAAFLLPIINSLLADKTDLIVTEGHCEPQVVIVSPTRELAIQIGAEARKFAHDSVIKTVVTYGGTAVQHQISQIMNGCHILVATPGRMNDFVERNRITFSSVRYVVLDEADRMLDMGFLPDIERVMGHETMVPTTERQTLMFSATFPEEIQRLASRFLNDYLFITVGIVGGACSDVQQVFHEVDKFAKRQKLLSLLTEEGTQRTLVFVETRRNADFIATYLSENSVRTTSIHGDRLQREREEALRDFKSGNRDILVATDVAARGLDIKDVKHVINYDLPKSIDEYVHRIGRTGRVGNRGKATSFYDESRDGPLAGNLVRILRQANQTIPDWLERAAAGGGGSYSSGRFGGRDVRGDDIPQANNFSAGAVEEPEEEW